MSALTTIEYVIFEKPPFVGGLAEPEVSAEFAPLPGPFLAALNDIHTNVDSHTCLHCGDPIGFALYDNAEGPEKVIWRTTSLARQGAGPVVMLCDDCAPWLDQPHRMTLTLTNRSEMAAWIGPAAVAPQDPGSDVLLVEADEGRVVIVLGETVARFEDGFRKLPA
jgi:hypothetical protein